MLVAMRKLAIAGTALLGLGLSACTNEQLYDSLAGWRRSTCTEIDAEDRARCLAEANKPYGVYKNERDAVTKPQQPNHPPSP